MLIKLKSPWPVLVMICNMCVPVCNRFHTKRANNVKITSFRGGTSIWRPRLRGTISPKGTKFCHDKRVFGTAHNEDLVILACTVLIQYSSVTNRRTDRRRPGHGYDARSILLSRVKISDRLTLCLLCWKKIKDMGSVTFGALLTTLRKLHFGSCWDLFNAW